MPAPRWRPIGPPAERNPQAGEGQTNLRTGSRVTGETWPPARNRRRGSSPARGRVRARRQPAQVLQPLARAQRPSLRQLARLVGRLVPRRLRVLLARRRPVVSQQPPAPLQRLLLQSEAGVRVRYLHSDVDTVERVEIIRDLRLGVFDVLVGINLLREGLDMPEVSLVAILDADKEGFLRNERSLVQTIGRAARNSEGRVIMYADQVTHSM